MRLKRAFSLGGKGVFVGIFERWAELIGPNYIALFSEKPRGNSKMEQIS
jgi:hypothetical protein